MNKEILQETIREWHSKTPDSVHGVGYGYKTKNGIKTDELCVVFSVLNKKPLAELTQEEILPTSLIIDNETIKTDIIETVIARPLSTCNGSGDTTSSDHRRAQRPLMGGISISHNEYGATAGTLGGLFRDKDDGSVVALTNLHVVCPYPGSMGSWSDSNRSVSWDIQNKSILQPGVDDGGISGNSIGNIKRYFPLRTGIHYNKIDAAVVGINNFVAPALALLGNYSQSQLGASEKLAYPVATSSLINDLFLNNFQSEYAQRCKFLVKSGRTTGYIGDELGCEVKVVSENYTTYVPYARGLGMGDTNILMDELIKIEYNNAGYNVVVGGDSGSLLIVKCPISNSPASSGKSFIVGLVFAGATDKSFGLACRIDTVMAKLNLQELGNTDLTTTNGSGSWKFITKPKPGSVINGLVVPANYLNPYIQENNMKYWECGQTSDDKTVYVTYGDKLTAPRNVRLNYSVYPAPRYNGQLSIAWDAPAITGPSPVIDYIVKYSSNNGATWKRFLLPSNQLITGLSCQITGLANGTKYLIKVVARNAVGIGPAGTSSQSFTPYKEPSVPLNVVITPKNTNNTNSGASYGFVVKWNAAIDNGGQPIIAYPIMYASVNSHAPGSLGAPWIRVTQPVSNPPATSAIVTGVSRGSYLFRIASQNGLYEAPDYGYYSAPVDTIVNTVESAMPPWGVQPIVRVIGNQRIGVSWAASTATGSDGGSPITDYDVYYRPLNGTPQKFGHAISGIVLGYDITGLTNGTGYAIGVAVKNKFGVSEIRYAYNTNVTGFHTPGTVDGAVAVRFYTPGAIPSAPRNVSVSRGNASLSMTWEAPLSNNGLPIMYYEVWYSSDNGASRNTASIGNGGQTTNLSCAYSYGLSNNITYSVKVHAKNAMGLSPASNTPSTTPISTLPGKPLNVIISNRNTQGALIRGGARLQWDARSFESKDGGSPIIEYIVKYSNRNGELGSWVGRRTGSNALFYTVTGLTPGISHVFRVFARNANGNSVSSDLSAPFWPS